MISQLHENSNENIFTIPLDKMLYLNEFHYLFRSRHYAHGGAYDVMSSKHIRGDVNLAFPTAEIAVMGPDGAVNILFRKEIDKAEKPEEKRKELQDDYRGKFANPYRAAELGYVDEVIDPAVTRLRLIRSFEMLANKRQSNPPKKHSNLPL